MKTIILKRLFTAKGGANDKRNNSPITSKYYTSDKYVLFLNSNYHKVTGNIDFKTFKTKREAQEYRDHYVSSESYLNSTK